MFLKAGQGDMDGWMGEFALNVKTNEIAFSVCGAQKQSSPPMPP